MDDSLPSLPQWKTVGLIAVLFFALTAAIYGHSLRNPFVRWDDDILVYQNPAIHSITPKTLGHIFTTYDPELYIPLTFFTYQLDYAVGGIDPLPYHLENLILHTLNALLVAWLFYLLTKNGKLALVCGLIFAAHPLHVEAVEWVSARKDVLCTFFFLLALIEWLRWRDYSENKRYVLCLLFFVLALLSKVTAVTFPVALLLLDWREKRTFTKELFLEKIPFFAVSILFGLIALGGKTELTARSTWIEKALMGAKSSVFYLQKILWPDSFSLLYPYGSAITFSSPDFFVPVLLCVLLITLAFFLRKRMPDLAFGLAFFFLTVAPTFFNFRKGGEMDVYFASDRYAYIPSIGIFLALTAVVLWLLRHHRSRIMSQALAVISSLLILGCAARAYAQTFVWNDTISLFENVIRVYPQSSYVAHNNLGNAYRLSGRLDDAIAEYQKSLAIRPAPKTLSNLGAAYRKNNQVNLALEQYQKALELDPKSKEAHFGLGIVYAALKRFPDAETEYRKAIELDALYDQAWTNLGVALYSEGKLADAMDAYRKALNANPYSPDAAYNDAIALTDAGKSDEAIRQYRTVTFVAPAFVPAHINLGLLLYKAHDADGARAEFETVLRIDPNNKTARQVLEQM